jgi:hypothetical protein
MTDIRITRVLEAIEATRPDELTCEDLVPEQRSLYVESLLAGEDASLRYPRFAHHLTHCPDCAQEVADLRRLLEMATEEGAQPIAMPVFDLSFLRSGGPVSAIDAARLIVERFYAEEAQVFDMISAQFSARLKELRSRPPASSRPRWLQGLRERLGGLFPRRPVPGFAIGLLEFESSGDAKVPMTVKVLVAATGMEEALSPHRAALARGERLPELVYHRLTELGQEAELPAHAIEQLIEVLLNAETSN